MRHICKSVIITVFLIISFSACIENYLLSHIIGLNLIVLLICGIVMQLDG